MRVDVRIDGVLEDMEARAVSIERAGYDAMWLAEAGNDPFLPLGVAAAHTASLQIGTAIAVAFGRSPLTTAQMAWDLNRFSKGRFVLGLGSQVRSHIERRYSMPWSRPAARMREYVLALRAIWETWATDAPLDFRGEFYSHTLMTPLFSPSANAWGAPKVHVAAVGPLMTEAAGEVADGLRVHSFTTERFLRERTVPSLCRGLERGGRNRGSFEVSYPVMVATGRTEKEFSHSVSRTRERLSFYGSTPAYRNVLDLHGWGDMQPELHRLAREGRWAEMPDVVSDEVVETFAVVAPIDDVAAEISRRYGDLIDRVSLYLSDDEATADLGAELIAAFRSAGTAAPTRRSPK